MKRIPAVILVLGAILRIAGTGASAIWYDEAATLYQSSQPFLTLWSDKADASGDLLLDLILRPLMLISHSVWMLRLPSMIAGLLSLWLVWKLMQKLEFTVPQQICASCVAAFLPGLLWIAQDARAYSLLSLLFLAAIWFAIVARYLPLLAVCGLLAYTHDVGLIYAIAALMLACYLHPAQVRLVLWVGLLSVLAWIPAVINVTSMGKAPQDWPSTFALNWLYNFSNMALWPVKASQEFSFAAFLVFLITLAWMVIDLGFRAIKKDDGGNAIPLFAWTLPILGLASASMLTHNNLVIYRTLAPCLFPFALWLGWEAGRERFSALILRGFWMGMLFLGLTLWHPSERGGGLDRVADAIRSQWRTGDTLVYTTATVALPFGYYLGDLPHVWDTTIQAPIIADAGIHRSSMIEPVPTRRWIVVPMDAKITTEEQLTLDELVNHQEPVWTIKYFQTAPVNVYLVKGK